MGYIFEAEIDSIINGVRARTIGEEDSISLRQVLASAVHPAVKAYFRAEVEKQLRDERAHEFRSKKFPYAHPEVVSLQRQIDLLLVQYYQFDRAEFETLLDQSVHFQFNYLCRPQWTLLSFILGDQRRIPVVQLERKLQYCVDYGYFPELIKRYIDDRGLAEISYEEFKSLLAKIDREIVAQHTSAELARMMRALFAFVDEGKHRAQDGGVQPQLPTNAAIVFFEDKQMSDITRRLEQERDQNNRTEVSLHELADLIEQVRTGDSDATAIYEPSKFPVQPEPQAEIVPADEEHPADGSQPGMTAGHIAPAENGTSPEPAQLKETRQVSPEEFLSVFDLFSPSEQKKFIRTIFGRDERAFRAALDELSRLESWQETSHFLDTLFVAQQVDPFGEPAVHFTDRLYTRFFPDGGPAKQG